MIRKIFASPYGVMVVVLCMYVAKVAAKLTIGQMIHSPMIEGDGWHNASDIFEACVVIATIWFSRLPASDSYPLGRRNIESIFSVVVGVFLALMSIKIAWFALVGLAHIKDGHATLILSSQMAPWVLGVTGGSALVSLFVSRYQIRVGKATGHEALVADGEETASDGRIELATFVGVCGEYLFDAPWIEYPFALIVAGLMVKTGGEIFSRGMGALLQRTIGPEHDEAIRNIVSNMYGIERVAQIKTFRTGNKVILILKVLSQAQPRVTRLMKEAVAVHIARYLREQEFEDGEFFIRFDSPPSDFHRRAVLIHYIDDLPRVATCIKDATHVIVCDVEYGGVTRATNHQIPDQDLDERIKHLGELLVKKRVVESILFSSTCDQTASTFPIRVVNGPSDQLAVYGL
ncbi:cation diffusion facilitator family transporter [Candidatus Uhrbacteria bacterium]|nr:cation diffusion facilitator family transporter [Candidatus Uhrbacteria bacterium]